MTILDFVRMTRHNLWRIVLCIIAGVAVMAAYSWTRPVLYAATSTGYVVVGNADSVGELYNGTVLAQGKAQSYIPIVTSTPVGQRIVEDLGLNMSPASAAGSLSASVVQGTVLFKVTAVSGNPEMAKKLADAAIRATSEEANRLETLRMNGQSSGNSVVRIVPIDQAVVPGAPFTPNWERNLMVGAGGGLALGYVIAFFTLSVDRRIRNQADMETLTNAGVLAIVPKVSGLSHSREVGHHDTFAGESVRQLRTNLRFVNVDNPPRAIVVTSPNPTEGKSTISANLSRLLAEAGHPTVLIDADLRRPTQARRAKMDNAVGLTQLLAGDITIDEAMVPSETEGLSLIPSGRIPPNPSELVGSKRMQALIDTLKEDYTVIIDAPPLLPVTDAGLLTAAADGCILVVHVGKTAKEQVKLCAKILERVNGKLLGSVLNMAPRRGIGAVVYGYGYGYTRYDQKYYYAEDGTRKRVRRSKKRAKRSVA
jgi:capsular exopolysaccharide synthesis family protein